MKKEGGEGVQVELEVGWGLHDVCPNFLSEEEYFNYLIIFIIDFKFIFKINFIFYCFKSFLLLLTINFRLLAN
jgi:hypothetical protein